jgi:cobalt transport protein ATP-binding subunit
MTDSATLIEIDRVSFSYEDAPPALRDVSLTIAPGEFVALTGANGSGKTTLAKHFNGLLRPKSGEVRVDGADAANRSISQLARTVGYVFQNPDHQIFLPSVAEEVSFGPSNLGVRGTELEERVEAALALFELRELRERHPTMLGRGVRRRVALAATYAMRPRLLVLDEPTGGLDRRATEQLMTVLHDLVDEGRSVVLITHDMRLVGEHAARMIVLSGGELRADGPTAEVMTRHDLLQAAGIRPPAVARLASDLRDAGLPAALTVDDFVANVVARTSGSRAGGPS